MIHVLFLVFSTRKQCNHYTWQFYGDTEDSPFKAPYLAVIKLSSIIFVLVQITYEKTWSNISESEYRIDTHKFYDGKDRTLYLIYTVFLLNDFGVYVPKSCSKVL